MICTSHPDGFVTKEIARFDIAWPEKPKEELKASNEENEEIKSVLIDYFKLITIYIYF